MLIISHRNYLLGLISVLIICVIVLLVMGSKKEMNELYQSKGDRILVIKHLQNNKNISPQDWNKIAHEIFNQYNEHDAFVVVHSPDTMTYTAAALSFMLENLDKMVVVSSPVNENDFKNVIHFAKNYSLPEVVVYDKGKILRGNCTKRVESQCISPNYPILGTMKKKKIKIQKEHVLPSANSNELKFLPVDANKNIVVLKLFPNMDASHLANVLTQIMNPKPKQTTLVEEIGNTGMPSSFGYLTHQSTKDYDDYSSAYGVQEASSQRVINHIPAIILETYGNGVIPFNNEFVMLIRKAVDDGVVVVATSQNMDNVNNQNLEGIGVLNGGKLTTESALAKLYVILTNVENASPEMVKQLMNVSMRGEL